jgi:RNA polymerase sigma factor (TIGR02999 family)
MDPNAQDKDDQAAMNESSPPSEVSALLARWRAGDRDAMDQLFALVYDELRRRAHAQIGRRDGDTLGTATLVHETFLRLVEQKQAAWIDRGHFFAVASLAMRQILVDRARRRLARKRGGGAPVHLLDEGTVRLDERASELLALDDALLRLKMIDERLAQVVDLRFFGGLTFEEAGEVLGLSSRTVKREWRKARAFLLDAVTTAEAR